MVKEIDETLKKIILEHLTSERFLWYKASITSDLAITVELIERLGELDDD